MRRSCSSLTPPSSSSSSSRSSADCAVSSRAIASSGDQDGAADVRENRRRYSDLRRELIGVERGVLLDLRNEGKLRPDVQRLIQRDLDLEEARLT